MRCDKSFNSRPLKEVDDKKDWTRFKLTLLSIHDLSRRSTIPLISVPHNHPIFQFTTSQGGRPFLSYQYPTNIQSFNSRPLKEVDIFNLVFLTIYCLSIHDLSRRSTLAVDYMVCVSILSIHDLSRRSTFFTGSRSLMIILSIHDLSRRSTAVALAITPTR